MKRNNYFNYIESHLNTLALRIKNRGKINLLDLNIHSETFFADMLNILLNLELKNLNTIKQNVEGIDLVDTTNKVIAQVSSTCTKQKIESSLIKEIFLEFNGYTFKFISIAENADKFRGTVFSNPHCAAFDSKSDIFDIPSILKIVLNMPIAMQKKLYTFIKDELGDEIDIVKVDTNLATIINILSDENLSDVINSPEINSFKINEKIDFNNLLTVQEIIDEYKVYYKKLDEKYTEFDKQGANKSLSVFRVIKSQYTRLSSQNKNESELFIAIVDGVIDIIIKSKNYKEIPYEELEMCAYILVVDAFIRCKIFKNPEGYSHVIAR